MSKDQLTRLRFADWKGAILIGTDWLFPKYASEFNHVPYYPAVIIGCQFPAIILGSLATNSNEPRTR